MIIKTKQHVLNAIPKLRPWFTDQELATAARITIGSANRHIITMVENGELERGQRFVNARGASTYLYKSTTLLGTIKRKAPRQVVHDKESLGPINNVYKAIIILGHDEDFEHKPASQPTGYMPGTREKIEVMIRRIERGEDPCHPDDARYYKAGGEEYLLKHPLRIGRIA